MNLTSLKRLYRYIGGEDSLTESTANDKILLGWIVSVSARIEKYLNRLVEKKERTQYFDTTYNRNVYYPDAIPIDSISTVKDDWSGLFNGSETELTDFYPGSDYESIVLDYPVPHVTKRGLQVVYTGGMAENPTRSTFAVTGKSGGWTAGNFAEGQTSLAMGEIISSTSDSITIDNYYGAFQESETVLEQETEGDVGGASGTAVISSITSQSLVEAYPDIARACELECRWMWKHRMDFENQSTLDGGVSRRFSKDVNIPYKLQPETMAMLARHVRYVV